MELTELNTFVAVAQAESFSKAADVLGYSQAAVTVRIKNLEEELGVRLFDRLGKRISLTYHGQELYERVVPITKQLKELGDSLRPKTQLDGQLRIGTIDSLTSAFFPELVRTFVSKHPEVTIEVITDTPQSLMEMLKNNRLDLIYMLDEQVHEPWAATSSAARSPILFVAEAGHPLADGKVHDFSELLEYPLALTEKDSSYRKVLESMLHEKDITIKPKFSSNNTDLILRVMKDSRMVTFLPRYNVIPMIKEGLLAEIYVQDIRIDVWRQLLYHKDKWVSPEMKAFVEHLLKERKNYNQYFMEN